MSGIIFRDTLRTQWKEILYWGFGMGFLGFYIVAISSDVDVLEGYSGMLELMPPAMLNLVGIGDASLLTSVEGFVSSAFVLYAMLMLSVFSVSAGLNITSSEEDEGIMDVLLALPISRTQIIIEKSLAYALLSLGIIIFSIILPTIALVLFNIDADMPKIMLAIFSIYPGMLLIIGITAMIGAWVRRRAMAIGLGTLFVISSYFLNFLGNSANNPITTALQPFSYFYHTNGQAIILDTYNPLSFLALLSVSVVCIGVAIVMFNRRDIGL